jgi:hypothetical protein
VLHDFSAENSCAAFFTDHSFSYAGHTVPAHFAGISILTFKMESRMTFHLLGSIP